MAGTGLGFSRGLMLGAGAALVYIASRGAAAPLRARISGLLELDAQGTYQLVDWELATRIGQRAAGRSPALRPAARGQLQGQYEALLRDIEQPISDYTGNALSLSGTRVQVVDRGEWVRVNVATFRHMLQPVERFFAESASRAGSVLPRAGTPKQAAQLVLSAEVGVLMGYMGRRVLGQYDLGILAAAPEAGGTLYFVEPNMQSLERSLDLPAGDLRKWIALHEATHAHEFELHPWVRQYLDEAMRSYLNLVIADLRGGTAERAVAALAGRLLRNLRTGGNLLSLFMSPEQQALVSRLQALMSLAEGYSNHVMNAVGRQVLPSFDTIHERVELRRTRRSSLESLFLRLTGLSMKMAQYKKGERFVDEVVRQRGIAFANRAWERAELLPTEHEISNPAVWIQRVGAAA